MAWHCPLPRQIIGWATIAETVLNESTSQIKHMSIYTINTHHVQNRSDDEAIVNTIHQTTTLFDEKNYQWIYISFLCQLI